MLVASGNVAPQLGRDLCDGTARFETNVAAPVRPTWINYTGGDTLHRVAASSTAVYVQGHPRWEDNPFGHDSCGPGCVPRPGIAALYPATGKALSWNPGKDRGEGGKDLLHTAGHLGHVGHHAHRRRVPLPQRGDAAVRVVGAAGFEPATPRL